MKNNYYDSIVMFEKLHRMFLDVLKYELNKLGLKDINNVQALIVYKIGKQKLSVGELTSYGCYLGSNISYNLRKIVENGYVVQAPSKHDRRSSEVQLTEKGMKMYETLGVYFEKHSNKINKNNLNEEDITNLIDTLKNFEEYLDKAEHR